LKHIVIDSKTACNQVSNAIIAVPAHNAAAQHILMTSIVNTKRLVEKGSFPAYRLEYTGPPVWTESVNLHGMTILIDYTFFPCQYYKRSGPCLSYEQNDLHATTSYAKHLWGLSWKSHELSTREKLNTGVVVDEQGIVAMH
jgi:hypothetical protein